MNLYFVFAAEGQYEGLHGMYDYAFEEAANEEELYDPEVNTHIVTEKAVEA